MAAVDYGFLGIRRSRLVSNGRSGAVPGKIWTKILDPIAKPIMPGVPYLIFLGVIVFEVVYKKEIAGRKAP